MIKTKPIVVIVAATTNGGIGRAGDMLYHISDDLKRFKRLTMGNTLIMGRKTAESLPAKGLPGRTCLTVSRQGLSLQQALDKAQNGPGDTIFIIGGGEIYRQTLSLADRVELTLIYAHAEDADTFFPALTDEWQLVSREEGEGLPKHDFLTYQRIKS